MVMKTKIKPKKKTTGNKKNKSSKQEQVLLSVNVMKSTEMRLKFGLSVQLVSLGGTKPAPITKVEYLLVIHVK